jgi:hypothetical protein
VGRTLGYQEPQGLEVLAGLVTVSARVRHPHLVVLQLDRGPRLGVGAGVVALQELLDQGIRESDRGAVVWVSSGSSSARWKPSRSFWGAPDEGGDNELLRAAANEKLRRGWRLVSMTKDPGGDSVELVWDTAGV